MKLKYYLRGLGTGIAAAALLIGISRGVSDKGAMTDEEVLIRAKELGMVERTVLAENEQQAETGETEESQTKAESQSEEESQNLQQASGENGSRDEEGTFGMPDEAGTVSLQIVKGDSSVSVSKRLAEAGLVDDAAAYDRYLCQNGYDKKIRVGNYEIPVHATQEEIARIITGG